MDIGTKLKNARVESGLTQERVAGIIQVSRQTISNWENEKSYPDIASVIQLSELYNISLDELLKGDAKMIGHLEESTDVVKSNKKLVTAIGINIVLLVVFILFNSVISRNYYLIAGCASVCIISTCFLFYQIIKKF